MILARVLILLPKSETTALKAERLTTLLVSYISYTARRQPQVPVQGVARLVIVWWGLAQGGSSPAPIGF